MKFQNKLSNKQVSSIWGIILSLVIIYILRGGVDGQEIKFLAFIAFVVLVGSIISLFEESHKRYKILKAVDTEDYDSNSEKMIADYFKAKSVKFYLHPQVKVPTKIWFLDNPFKKRILKPDFFLPQYNAFVEYWGRLDDEDYRKKTELKKKSYEENDIEFISLTPKDLEDRNRLDWNFTQKLLNLIRDREGNNLEWRK